MKNLHFSVLKPLQLEFFTPICPSHRVTEAIVDVFLFISSIIVNSFLESFLVQMTSF